MNVRELLHNLLHVLDLIGIASGHLGKKSMIVKVGETTRLRERSNQVNMNVRKSLSWN